MKKMIFAFVLIVACGLRAADLWFDAAIGDYLVWPPAASSVQGGAWTNFSGTAALTDLAELKGMAPRASLAIGTGADDLSFKSSKLALGTDVESVEVSARCQIEVCESSRVPAVPTDAKAAIVGIAEGASVRIHYLAKNGTDGNAWFASTVLVDPGVEHLVSFRVRVDGDVAKAVYTLDGTCLTTEEVEICLPDTRVSAVSVHGTGELFALSGSCERKSGVRDPDGPTLNTFRVTPYVQRPAPTAMTVMWLAEAAGDATLEYWKEGTLGRTVLSAVRKDALSSDVTGIRFKALDRLEYCQAPELGYGLLEEDKKDDTKDNVAIPWQYRARLTGLTPDTVYRYRVALANGSIYENRFRTAPSADAAGWRGFKFIYYSDSETEPADDTEGKGYTTDWTDPVTGGGRKYYATQTEAYASNVCEAVSFGSDLIVMAGDLAQKGSKQCDWDEFWRHNAGRLNDPAGSIPILAAPGNHDYHSYTDGGETGIKKFMSYLEAEPNGANVGADIQERFHRVDYGPVTFIFLDGNKGDESDSDRDTTRQMTRASGCRAPDFNVGTEQYNWLEAQLADARERSAFTFIVSHQCPFSVGYHGRPNGMNNLGSLEQWSGRALRTLLPLLHKYGVDGWFAGHDEMMERSVHEGEEVLPDGTRVPHSFSVWDMGIAGDGLRGTKFIENEYEAFRADVDSPEETNELGKVVYGGKHYGHLQVSIEKDDDGRWKATFDPIYILFTQDPSGKSVFLGKRHYADKQVRYSNRFRTAPVVVPAKPVMTASVDFVNYVPTAKPQSLMVTFYDGPLSRGFAWQTEKSVTEGKVWLLKGEYDATVDDLFDRAELVGEGSCTMVSDPELACHHAHVLGLERGATYSYRVGANGNYAYGRFTVRGDPGPVTIVNFNDVQTSDATKLYMAENAIATAVRTAGGAGKVDCVISGGDLSDLNVFSNFTHTVYGDIGYRVNQYWKWAVAADTVTPYFPGVPWLPVPGNHDFALYRDTTTIDYWTEGLGSAGCQSVDYGEVHIATLPYLGGWSSVKNQYAAALRWLDADLKANHSPWKIVCLHWGPYATGDHTASSDTIELARLFAPICASNHVDLVLQAHDHTYSKSVPYRWDTLGYTDDAMDGTVLNLSPRTVVRQGVTFDVSPKGTYYVSAGCAGHRVGESCDYADVNGANSYATRKPRIVMGKVKVDSKWMGVGEDASRDLNAQMFGVLRIAGPELSYSFYVAEPDGTATLVDILNVRKESGFTVLLR